MVTYSTLLNSREWRETERGGKKRKRRTPLDINSSSYFLLRRPQYLNALNRQVPQLV